MDQKGLFEFLENMITKGEPLEVVREKAWEIYGTKCAMLVMDSSGFTQISRKYGIVSFLACLVRARRIIEDAFSPYNNLSFRAEADNVYGIFKTPEDAYHAAVNANHLIRDNDNLTIGNFKFNICIGIGYGRVLNAGQEGVYGDKMNLTSKLGEDLAQPGQILLTESAFNFLENPYQSKFSKSKTTISNIDISYYQSEFH